MTGGAAVKADRRAYRSPRFAILSYGGGDTTTLRGRRPSGRINASRDDMAPLGKALIALGIVMIVLGGLVWGLGSVPYVGRLPGDIYIRRDNWSLYFPLTTCILLSIAITLIFLFFGRR